MAPKFEMHKDSARKFRWRLKDVNGEIIANSKAYESETSYKNGIQSGKKNAPTTEIVKA